MATQRISYSPGGTPLHPHLVADSQLTQTPSSADDRTLGLSAFQLQLTFHPLIDWARHLAPARQDGKLSDVIGQMASRLESARTGDHGTGSVPQSRGPSAGLTAPGDRIGASSLSVNRPPRIRNCARS